MLHFGKTPARPGAMKIALGDYLKTSQLPKVPPRFGNLAAWNHWQWQMLANDRYGCCVWSGQAHQIMMWCATEGNKTVQFTDDQILGPEAYGSTGFVASDPSTDNGTDMVTACQFWKDNGLFGHTLIGFAEVKPANIALTAFQFGSCGVGISLTQANMDQFNNAEPWDYVEGSPTLGGHYVPAITKNSRGNLVAVTWGRLQPMTDAFLEAQCDEAVCQLSQDWLNVQTTITPRGLKLTDLIHDMKTLANS
jgi:hypothetical protein